jgi:Flp pilus assembly protein TadB
MEYFLLGIGVFLFIYTLLQIVFPGFKKQKFHLENAKKVIANEHEKIKNNTDIATYSIFRLFEKHGLISHFSSYRKIYNLLNKSKPFGIYLASCFLNALIVGSTSLIAVIITKTPMYLILFPILFIITFYANIRELHTEYKNRQNEIIKDLPPLIDKLMISLEANRPFLHAFEQVERNSGKRMKEMIRKLIANMKIYEKQTDAIEEFAKETDIPVMNEFAVAVKIGIENGYGEAKEYLEDIKEDIQELRNIALEELTKNNPQKMTRLYALLIVHAFIAAGLVFWEIFKQIDQI